MRFSSFFSLFISLFILLNLPLSAAGRKDIAKDDELLIWCYDSFVSEWGPAAPIAEAFESETGANVRFVPQGDGAVLFHRALSHGKESGVDIVIGLDDRLLSEALASGDFLPYKPEGSSKVDAELFLDSTFALIPYNWGSFAINYDSQKIKNPPKSLEDLCSSEYKRSLILIDPRTSTVGLGFFAWVKAVYGEDWRAYWQRLSPSILTVADGWDSAYGIYTRGEAPLVLSYTTSPAYHLEWEETERYRAAIFNEGHIRQVEFAGILKSSAKIELAKRFMDFMLNEGFQKELPLTNWMYPVKEMPLPDSFSLAPVPTLHLKSENISDKELDEWVALIK